jgi:hypothetical protein
VNGLKRSQLHLEELRLKRKVRTGDRNGLLENLESLLQVSKLELVAQREEMSAQLSGNGQRRDLEEDLMIDQLEILEEQTVLLETNLGKELSLEQERELPTRRPSSKMLFMKSWKALLLAKQLLKQLSKPWGLEKD